MSMNIVVAGGGTAGWLTALYAKKVFPEHNITLIESEEIGILGAGEGTTPHLIDLLNFLEIHPPEIIKHAGALIKNGIKFTGWDKDKNYYYHPFSFSSYLFSSDYNNPFFKSLEQDPDFAFLQSDNNNTFNNEDEFNPNTRFLQQNTEISHLYGALENQTPLDYSLTCKMCEMHKVPFIMRGHGGIFSVSTHALHFNATELASYLRKVSIERGIERVEGKIENVETNNLDEIVNLHIDTDRVVPVDFVFDCTGFKHLLIGKHFKSEWKSHKEHLPAKKALPFTLPLDDSLPPYTESTAMDYGWMWKIPVRGRYGCGYVFDSDFISDDNAKKEIETYLGFKISSPRTFIFEAGCYKKIWIKNCLAVGLASGFIEPLEATSIMQLIYVLERFLANPLNISSRNESVIKRFNDLYLHDTQEVVDFVYLHYVTNKQNTSFWKNFTQNNKMPEFVEYILNVIKDRPLIEEDFKGRNIFTIHNYMYVLMGNGLLSKTQLINLSKFLRTIKIEMHRDIINRQKKQLDTLPQHTDFISSTLSL